MAPGVVRTPDCSISLASPGPRRVLATRRFPGEAWNELRDVEVGTPDRHRDDVEVLVVANERVDEPVLDLFPALRLVASFGVGLRIFRWG